MDMTREDTFGLTVALVAHGALIVVLTLSPLGRKVEPPPQRMVVSFAAQVADQSASPKPDALARPDLAPTSGAPDDHPSPAPEPTPFARPKSGTAPPVKPEAEARPKTAAKPSHDPKPAGASRIGKDFLSGIAGVTTPGTDKVSPGDTVGAVPVASLVSAISRQILPHWKPPSGIDTDKLVVVLAWTLHPDGTLASDPVIVSQSGLTDANRAQAPVFAANAIKAVRLAARPFQLPPQAYAQWQRVRAFRFDYKLTQQEKR